MMPTTTTLERVTLSDPFCVLEFDPVGLFVPMSGSAWNASQPSRRAWREALGSDGTLKASHVRYHPTAPLPVDTETDCMGRTALVLNKAALAQMVVGSGHGSRWSGELAMLVRHGRKPKHLRRWLRTFLQPDDAERVEASLIAAYRRASADLPTMQRVG